MLIGLGVFIHVVLENQRQAKDAIMKARSLKPVSGMQTSISTTINNEQRQALLSPLSPPVSIDRGRSASNSLASTPRNNNNHNHQNSHVGDLNNNNNSNTNDDEGTRASLAHSRSASFGGRSRSKYQNVVGESTAEPPLKQDVE